MLRTFKNLLGNDIYKGSVTLASTSLVISGSGFLFWLVAARLYSSEAVGNGAALISSIGLLTVFSKFGFEISLNRFIPTEDNPLEILIPSLGIPLIVVIILSIGYILSIRFWSPELTKILLNPQVGIIFVLICFMGTLLELQREGIFVGFRTPKYSLFQAFIGSSRIVLLILFVTFGSVGILLSFGLSVGITALVGVYLLNSLVTFEGYLNNLSLNIRGTFRYSLWNYLAQIADDVLVYSLPLLVLNIQGPEVNALFYIAWQINMVFTSIPRWISKLILAEGVLGDGNEKLIRQSFITTISILVVGIIFAATLGEIILGVFGSAYTGAYELLIILLLGSIPFTVVMNFATIKRVNDNLFQVVITFASLTIGTLILSLYFVTKNGVIGVGYSWLTMNIVLAICIFIYLRVDDDVVGD